jgi:intracellular sulfur oxidation DsrE/DsrF family protein
VKKMKKVIVLNSEGMGRGDEELGGRLLGNFLRKVWASPEKPATIVFYNSAVKLLAYGAMVSDALDGLSLAGVDLVACGTCVNHYQLSQSLAMGRVSDMQEIVELLMATEQVITL